MARGYSLHIGVAAPRFEPSAPGADVSAEILRGIARAKGFEQPDAFGGLLIDDHATKANVLSGLKTTVSHLSAGDILLVTFTGHGRWRTGYDEDEDRDQSLVLSDTEWVDNEIYDWLASIHVAARVLFIVDACFSGSILTTPIDLASDVTMDLPAAQRRKRRLSKIETREFLHSPVGWRLYAATFPRGLRPPLEVSALLLASSEDRTTTFLPISPLLAPPFTRALEAVWQASATYRDLRNRIKEHLFSTGELAVPPVLNDKLVKDLSFVRQMPFTI